MNKANSNLHKAKSDKKDEFYTQLTDIEKEKTHYKDHFKSKVVYCNCDDTRVNVCYGLDFRFIHPTVIIESFEYNGNLYITQESVKTGADLEDITKTYFRVMDLLPKIIWVD